MIPATPQLAVSKRRLALLAASSALVLALGVMIDRERIWSNLLIASFFLVNLGLGGALFIALAYVSNASWNVAFRRVPEALTRLLLPAGLAMLTVLVWNRDRYAWHFHGEGDPGTFWFKQMWTDPDFWTFRAIGYLALWILLGSALVNVSWRQDQSGRVELTYLNRYLSGFFLVVYAITFSLASFDWLMLLEPMWFSTIWGVYHFAGMVQSTLAAMILFALLLRSWGLLQGSFTDDHLHDLGKLLLGFSCFWMYIWFSQYLLIWYTNIPEETSYYILRTRGPWGPIIISNLVLNWIVPFFVLLPRPCKRNAAVITRVAVVVLIGRWVDLYLMVFPSTIGKEPAFGIWELASIGLLAGSAGWLFFTSFGKASPVPSGDPLLAESLHHHC